jgi:hypothetical protein
MGDGDYGGSWNNPQDNARCANRNHNHPDDRNENLGFRCCSKSPQPVGSGAPPARECRPFTEGRPRDRGTPADPPAGLDPAEERDAPSGMVGSADVPDGAFPKTMPAGRAEDQWTWPALWDDDRLGWVAEPDRTFEEGQ